MQEESDKTLIARAITGQDQAFEQLVQRYQQMIAQLVWRLVPLPGDREEICQDVFVKAYFSLRNFRFDSKFSTWLYAVAYRTALSFLRKHQPVTESFEAHLHDGIEEMDDRHELAALLQIEIGRLNLEERTCITLYHIQGCSIDEIARITSKPAGTIKNLLFRTRRKLKQRLEPTLLDEFKEVV